MEKINWQKLQDFQNENKDLLIMIASPKDDAISISYGGLNSFVKFPGKDLADSVVFNALRKSKFKEAIGPFMTGFSEGSGITPGTSPLKKGEIDPASEVLNVLGGSVQAFGEQKEIIKNKLKK